MSFFGKNIKKIRTVKGLSQSAFADIFSITRASIGSYEEGRAEPKVDTIIQIADYFKLTLDKLLKSELTVNDIQHFDQSKFLLPENEIIPKTGTKLLYLDKIYAKKNLSQAVFANFFDNAETGILPETKFIIKSSLFNDEIFLAELLGNNDNPVKKNILVICKDNYFSGFCDAAPDTQLVISDFENNNQISVQQSDIVYIFEIKYTLSEKVGRWVGLSKINKKLDDIAVLLNNTKNL